ncbi:PadR family transcriptional regulator [Desulfofundulus sp.]|uniref:PadR family transcriptional regulator n=1 Tax=Desulfofundulus sp. TaxID=2282750 RepID=UPI003C7970DA
MDPDTNRTYNELVDLSKLCGGLFLKGLLPFYVLCLLSKEKMYGKQIMDRIMEMTRGNWKPSPGSIYPMLQKMERMGLISQSTDPARGLVRVYELTARGRQVYLDMREEIKPRLAKTIEVLRLHLAEI